MIKKFLFIFLFNSFALFLSAQENVQMLIHKRDSVYSLYQKENPMVIKDSLSDKASKQMKSLIDILEQDNLIIDIVNDKVSVYAKDTAVTNKLTAEITKQNKELDQKNNMLTVFLLASIVSSALMVLFAILFLSAFGTKKKLKKEFELSALNVMKLQAEKEELNIQLGNSQNNYKTEYIALKEASEKEIIRNKEIHRALLKEIERVKQDNQHLEVNLSMVKQADNSNPEIEQLKTELKNTTRYIHDAKEENARILAENADLKETLKTLSNVPPERIEEMELNLIKIERLTQMLIDGKITEEEFDEKRKMLLDEL